ncbi:MAG: hypothetical protein Q3983_03185 [Capnocytophaga sp.]|nr:hypothetical protein [Capnocytophaga sp.]
MDKIYSLVAELELKLPLLNAKIMDLERENNTLKAEIVQMKNEKCVLEEKVQKNQEKYDALKVVSTILGSEEHKTEVKLKINALIREIDACIAQFS